MAKKQVRVLKEVTITKEVWQTFFMKNIYKDYRSFFLQFRKACNFFGVHNQAMFLAQLCHESGFLKHRTENLNYSMAALLRVFPKYFKNENIARQYARQPQKIANRVYANRMGNGPATSNDGWKYRGRLLIQTTGKNNYRKLDKFFKGMYFKGKAVNVLKDPDILLNREFLFWPAALYYVRSGCNLTTNIRKVTKIINGGYNGLSHRTKIYKELLALVEQKGAP